MTKNKMYTIVYAIIALSMLLSACSEKTEYINEDETNTIVNIHSPLLSNLQSINDSIASNSTVTRGWTSMQTIDVIRQDIKGAYKGGKVGMMVGGIVGKIFGQYNTGRIAGGFVGGLSYGSYCSWKAAPKSLKSMPNQNFQPTYPYVSKVSTYFLRDDLMESPNRFYYKVENPGIMDKIYVNRKLLSEVNLTKEQLNIGLMHNVLLASYDGSLKVDFTKLSDVSGAKDSLNIAILESEEMEKAYNDLVTKGDESQYVEQDEIPDAVMQLFDNVFKSYATDCSNVVTLVNKYIDAIDNSDEITYEQKNLIKNGLATALYSMNYWNTSTVK